MADQYYYAVGKRKTSVARVRMFPGGEGKVEINGKPFKEYFTISAHQGVILEPLKVVEQDRNVNLTVRVEGGGSSSQAEAVRHGVARGLVLMDKKFRGPLKQKGFLTRDARKVERKKPGLKKARRAPQWAKR